ncbi:hypothetical protein BX667DRAFT_328866 [Coemansia mojavensis]|nr:hypothetical protein BX667DRAFT_328866 [Coemansia mojavensis]
MHSKGHFNSELGIGDNPWTETSARPQQHACLRAAQRRRATNDPLLCPSAADVSKLNQAVARRAEHGMLESLDDAVSSPLPRFEAFMLGVQPDKDAAGQNTPTMLNFKSPCNLAAAAETRSNPNSQRGLGIAQGYFLSSDSQAVPQAIPERNNVLFEYCGGTSTSKASSSILDRRQQLCTPTLSQSLPLPLATSTLHSPLRSIKMIRHLIRESETLEGISVQYGISTADLKRLNRLWQPNEIATRKHLYIPLRLCLPKFTLDNIEHINKQYEDELRNRNVSDFQPIEVIEVVLDPDSSSDILTPQPEIERTAYRRPWPLVPYESIQRVFSFTL